MVLLVPCIALLGLAVALVAVDRCAGGTPAAGRQRVSEAGQASGDSGTDRAARELDLTGEPPLEWADRPIDVTRLALSPDKATRGCFHGTSACVSALFTAGRNDELIELVQSDVLWSYK